MSIRKVMKLDIIKHLVENVILWTSMLICLTKLSRYLPMPTRKDFKVEKCTDCLRVTRTDIPGDKHTHCKSKHLAETIINNVCSEKIPLHSHSRTLESMKRLSCNEKYIKKIEEILNVRNQKGRKQSYFNPGIKKSF